MAGTETAAFNELLAVPLRNGLTRPKAVRGKGVKMVNMGELFAHDRIRAISMDRVVVDEREREYYLLEPGDLLFARQSLVLAGAGKCSILLEADEPVTFESHIIRARLDRKSADPLFYFYFFRSTAGRNAIESIVEQVAAAGIRGSDLANLAVPKPPLPEQRAIARILGTLDDKIDSNQRMNETLEAIARAIFKSWFVDFDPIRAKAEGRDLGLPQPIANSFPDSFEDSDSGEIPKGWRTARLGDADIFPLVSPGVEVHNGDKVHYIATGDVHKNVITSETESEFRRLPSRANMQPGQGRVWFAKMKDSPKHLWTMREDGCWWASRVLSTGFAGIEARVPQHEGLLYCFISSRAFDDAKNLVATGTTMQALNNETIGTIRVVVPGDSIAACFDRLVRPLYRRVWHNFFESRAITALRDTLLPKLMTGEIRIPISKNSAGPMS